MAEEIRQPDSDIITGDWTTPPLWSKIDEGSGSPDVVYIVCPGNKGTSFECSIQDPTNLGIYTAIQIKVYVRKSAVGGNQRGIDADVRIDGNLQGQQTLNNDLPETWAEYTYTWSGLNFTQSQMNSLQILGIPTGTTGGAPANRREVHIDYYETTLTYTPGVPKPTQYLAGNDCPEFPHEMDLDSDKLPCPPPY